MSSGSLAHRRFGGDEQAGDRGRVLERGADDLGRIDHAGLDQVLVDLGLGVEAHRLVLAVDQLAGDDGAVMARILGDLADRRLQRAADDVDAAGLVVIGAVHALERLGGVEQSGAAAGDDAFLDRGAGGVERVVDAVLALLDLDLGRAADLDHGNAAGELGETLLELLLVIVAGGVLDLLADRLDPALDLVALAGAVDDGGVVLVDGDALGLAEHARR